MELTNPQRIAMARLLARGLPSWQDRENAASRAGLTDVQLTGSPQQVWELLVDEAVAQDRLGDLVRAASRLAPDDVALQRLADGMSQGKVATPGPGLRLAIAGTALMALGGFFLLGSSDPVGEGEVPQAAEQHEDRALRVEPAQVETPAPTEVAEAPAEAPEVAEAPQPVDEVEQAPQPPVEQPAEVEPVAATPPPAAAPPTTPGVPCESSGGFAFLGEQASGVSAGREWVVPRAVNVRLEYPSEANRWNARTEVQCVLPRGARVSMAQDPVRVDGNVYWVYVAPGSVRLDR